MMISMVFILAVMYIVSSLLIASRGDYTRRTNPARDAAAMPLSSPSYPPPPYRFINREYFIITYRTDPDLIGAYVPYPLEVFEPVVQFEFIRMPDSSGLGDYTEAGQVIPVRYKEQEGSLLISMFLDNEPAILAGREIWGFPKKAGLPFLGIDRISRDTLIGRLHYGELEVARGTMGYKWKCLPEQEIQRSLEERANFLVKLIPDPDGTPRIHELVKYHLGRVSVRGAWTGPADLQFFHHALAPVADLPVIEVISGVHFIADLTLLPGTVEHSYR